MVNIKENLAQVRQRMAKAAQRAGRDREQITLVGVTKTHPPETVLEGLAAGLQHVGENRVHELESKRPLVESQLGDGSNKLTWHMIGHVQSRKAAPVVHTADILHSLESLKLAGRLDRFAAEQNKILPVLLEINLSGEGSKYGLPAAHWENDPQEWSKLCEFVRQVGSLENLSLEGLMTMAPWVPDETVIRPVFRSARKLRERLAAEFPSHSWQHLSMGMTDDFEIAIEEGATVIRVGRAIFGPRVAR